METFETTRAFRLMPYFEWLILSPCAVLSSIMTTILTHGTKSVYNLVCVRGLLVYCKNCLCENNARPYVFTPLCGRLSMTLTLPCMSNKSSYFSQITFYNKHAISDIQSPLRFHYISCISSYLGDDVMMLPQHLTFVSKFD